MVLAATRIKEAGGWMQARQSQCWRCAADRLYRSRRHFRNQWV